MRLLAVMQQEWSRCGRIDKGVGTCAGSQHQGAVARREWLGRLSVQRHHLDLVAFQFDRQNSALRAIDEAQPQPLDRPAAESSNEVCPLIV